MSSPKPSYLSYDDEFKYADEIEPNLAAIMQEVENGPRHKPSNQSLEEYQRLYEANVESRKKYRFEQQDDFKIQREGRILHMNVFLSMLKRAGLNCWYNDKGGMARTLGLNVFHEGLHPSCKHLNGEPHYVCFVQVPFMQEYEEMHFDRYDVPLGPKRRGWRTVLLRLMEDNLITEKKAHEIFGEPITGPVSRRYRHYLQFLRNKP